MSQETEVERLKDTADDQLLLMMSIHSGWLRRANTAVFSRVL